MKSAEITLDHEECECSQAYIRSFKSLQFKITSSQIFSQTKYLFSFIKQECIQIYQFVQIVKSVLWRDLRPKRVYLSEINKMTLETEQILKI